MKRVVLIGANGFVGQAFYRLLSTRSDIDLICVNRNNYYELSGTFSNIVIDVAGSSEKYIADNHPLDDFERSACHCFNVLHDYPSDKHIHISSVDVYSDINDSIVSITSRIINLR